MRSAHDLQNPASQPEKLQAIQEYRLLIFAALVLCILLFRPSGILPRPLRDLSRFAGKNGAGA